MHQHDDHDHFTQEDHDHILAISADAPYEEIEGLEKLTISSVGIDIGSSTSHLVFSR